MPTQTRIESGFTLLEVLVALAIAIPALVLIYRQGALALDVARSASAYQEAVARARSHLAQLIDTDLLAGEREGDEGNGFHWRTSVRAIGQAPPPREPPRASPYVGGTALFSVVVEMSWPGVRGTRALALETRRIGPAPP